MKKSKFLKKSLAMLLALMLVVAMIPLSASAADPKLDFLYINDISVANSNGSFATEIFYEDTTVNLRTAAAALDYSDGKGSLQLFKEGTTDVKTIANSDSNSGNTKVTLADWDTDSSDSTYTLNLRLLDKDGNQIATYTVVLTESQKKTSASLEENSATEGTGTYDVDINNGSHDINVTVADGALEVGSNPGGINFTVRTQDNATMDQTPATGVTVTKVTGNIPNLYNVRVTSVATNPVVTVTSESGKNTATWQIKITEVGAVTAFSLGENGEYEGTIDGYDIYVTVPKDVCHNQFGEPVDIELPVHFTVRGNNDAIKYVTDGKYYQDGADFPLGKLENPDGTYEDDAEYHLDVTAAGYKDLQKYTLHVSVEEESTTAIQSVWINDREATQDGYTYTANLPQQAEDGKATDLDAVTIRIYTEKSAAIQSISGFYKSPDTYNDIPGTTMWVSDTDNSDNWGTPDKVSISKGLQVVVKAENGDTQTYTLNATIETNTDRAAIETIYITDPDGTTQAQGDIVGNTITFTVPYMTLRVDDWKVYAYTNASADAVYSNGTQVVRNGVTTMSDLNAAFSGDMAKTGANAAKAIKAENMNDAHYFQEYDIVVKLGDVSTDKTLSKFEMSIQTTSPDRNDKVTARVNDLNSVTALASGGTITQETKASGATGTITFNVPYGISTKSGESLYKILTDIETNGGVAFLAQKGAENDFYGAVQLADLPAVGTSYTGNTIPAYTDDDGSTFKAHSYYVIVLPQETAREVLLDGDGNIQVATEANKGTVYRLIEKPQDASNEATMRNLSVGEVDLSIQFTHDVVDGEITGALPWSYTAEYEAAASDIDTTKAMFLDYEIDAFATLTTYENRSLSAKFNPGGDVDGDGEADEIDTDNQALIFVRAATGNGVEVYSWDGTNDPARLGDDVATQLEDNLLTVYAEDGSSHIDYNFKLTYNQANTEAELESFSIGASTGRISGNDVYITVPYGSDLMGLIPTFTVSDYASVKLDSRTGEDVISGKTSVNFNQTVRLMVISEDGQKTNPYNVHVTVSEAFSDVVSGSWYYDNVMQAAANGIVSGYPDGTFKPGNSVTRRDFAIMLTQMLGVSNDGTAVSPFIDVDEDDYGVVAIAYCKAQGIISGYEEDGTFRPDNTITRQEAASMIVKAMGVSQASDEAYPDDSQIASWAKDAVYKAKAAGLMKGYEEDGTFRPTGKITRAEAASIMVNALNQ